MPSEDSCAKPVSYVPAFRDPLPDLTVRFDSRFSLRAAGLTCTLALLAACGDDSDASNPPDADVVEDATSDSDTTPDASPDTDTAPDAASDDDADTVDDVGADPDTADADGTDDEDDADVIPTDVTDTTPPPTCDAPARRIGEGDAAGFAANAAQCGQAPFAWLDTDELGAVVTTGRRVPFRASVLRALLGTLGVTLPLDLRYDTAVWPVTYVTQDRGELIEATGLIALPTNRAPEDGPAPLLIGLHGTSGFTDGCGVSNDDEWRALMALFASLGFAVASPDYIGLREDGGETGFLHPYLNPQATALASLDLARSVSREADTLVPGLCTGTDVLLFGGSQGGHAALWVDRLQPYYAAEYRLRGGVATVAPADVVGQIEAALLEARNATANSIALLGTAWSWYGLDLAEVILPPWDDDVPAALGASCNPSRDLGINDLVLEEVFTPALLEAAADGRVADLGDWGCVVRESSLLATSIPRLQVDEPDYGILLVLGSEDNLVDTPIERAAYEVLCEADFPATLVECEGASHGGATFAAIGTLLDFLEARRDGQPFVRPATCEAPPAVTCQ